MNILDNPFKILDASLRDTKTQLSDLSEDYELLHDSKISEKVFSDLTSPRKRLKCEISWLLGVSEISIKSEIEQINIPINILNFSVLSPLAKANLLASSLEYSKGILKDDLVCSVVGLSKIISEIHTDEVLILVNQERRHSKFPQISSLDEIENEIYERHKFYSHAVIRSLDSLSSFELVSAVTEIVEEETNFGKVRSNDLIRNVVNHFEVKAQQFFCDEEENIDKAIKNILSHTESGTSDQKLSIYIDELICIVKNWDSVAQPIQLLSLSQGLSHERSTNLAHKIRSLSLTLFNDFDKLSLTKKLTQTLKAVFAEDIEFAEKAEQDMQDLEDILNERVLLAEKSKEEQRQFELEVSYNVEIGAIFKDKLSITSSVIEWKGTKWDTDKITRVRWGGISRNSGTEYQIVFGNSSNLTEIIVRRKSVYIDIIDRLWKIVGFKIMMDYINKLENNQTISLGNFIFNDFGVELEKTRMFSANESEFCSWSEIQISNHDGSLVISKIGDENMCKVISYLNNDNIHIVESMIRILFKKSTLKLSGIFLN